MFCSDHVQKMRAKAGAYVVSVLLGALTVVLADTELLDVGGVATVNKIKICADKEEFKRCLTFDEYILRDLKNIGNDTILEFFPGSHSLNTSFHVHHVNRFSMVTNSHSEAIMITCTQPATMTFTHVGQLKLQGLAIVGCGNSSHAAVNIDSVKTPSDIGFERSAVLFDSVSVSNSPEKGVMVHNSSFLFVGNTSFNYNLESGFGLFGSNLTMKDNVSFVGNMATNGGGLQVVKSRVTVEGGSLTLINNSATHGGGGGASFNGGVLNILAGHIKMVANTAYEGGGLLAVKSRVTVEDGSLTLINNSATYGAGGGALFKIGVLSILAGYVKMVANTAYQGGGMLTYNLNMTVEEGAVVEFSKNTAQNTGGAIYVSHHSTLHIKGGALFSENSGSALHATTSSIKICNSSFINSGKGKFGGAVHAASLTTELQLCDVTFSNNSASNGGSIYLSWTSAELCGNILFVSNMANNGGAIYSKWHRIFIHGNATFINNTAVNSGGAIYIQDLEELILEGKVVFENNMAGENSGTGSDGSGDNFLSGGAIFIFSTYSKSPFVVTMTGETLFLKNTGQNGGAICARSNTESNIQLMADNITRFIGNSAFAGGAICLISSKAVMNYSGEVEMSENYARGDGGALFMYRSSLKVQAKRFTLDNNTADLRGGAVYSFLSNVTIMGFNSSTVNNNVASEGGGFYLTAQSYIIIGQYGTMNMSSNHAFAKGGAVFVEDEDTCSVISPPANPFCFLARIHSNHIAALFLANNSAGEAGNVLYGGNVNSCIPLPAYSQTNTFDRLSSITDFISNGRSVISSNPFNICRCNDSQLACNSNTIKVQNIFPGQLFTVSIATVGQTNGTVPSSVTIESTNSNGTASPQNQRTNYTCTILTYTLSSHRNREKFLLRVGGKCSAVAKYLSVNAIISDCPLFRGFQLSTSTGKCDCAHRLVGYTQKCYIEDQTIDRETNFWASACRIFSNKDGNNESSGLILHPHCPFDYCTSHTSRLNLEEPDEQCKFNRTGLLCGECNDGLSLTLGSSKCQHCSNLSLLLLLAFAFAGIALVVFMFVCHLTVAKGSVNGLIFYANIVHSNHSIFFTDGSNFLSVFIAWLNLDLGIEMCFYNGMDMYGRTWLQFAFPAYIWLLCGLLVFVSSKSRRVSALLGSNPVAILTTLFLLSYTKILRTLISALSFTRLQYPNSTSRFVWLYDANIEYLRGVHIPLFVVGLFALLLCFPYTVLLLIGHLRHRISSIHCLRWLDSARLKFILDTYYAPYKAKHHYWTGLLLVARFALLLVFATNVFGDPSINLLAISIASAIIFLWQCVINGGPYRYRVLNSMEAVFIVNLNLLATSSLFSYQLGHTQVSLTYTSLTISLAIFLSILVYHALIQLRKLKVWMATTRRHETVVTPSMERTMPALLVTQEVWVPGQKEHCKETDPVGFLEVNSLLAEARVELVLYNKDDEGNLPTAQEHKPSSGTSDVNSSSFVVNRRVGLQQLGDSERSLPTPDYDFFTESEDNSPREPLLDYI